MRILLDSNVLLAAFTSHGLCEAVLETCLHSHDLVLCDQILSEVERNLRRKFKMPAALASGFALFLRGHAERVEPAALPHDACDDKDDLPILGAAVAGGVDYLVTGDRHLLKLNPFRQIPVLSPREFYDCLQ